MVDDLESLRDAAGADELVRAYATALAGPAGADPVRAGRLRRAYLERRRVVDPAENPEPPPLPAAARKPRVRGRLARHARLSKRGFPRKAGYSATIVMVIIFAILKGLRACDRITGDDEKEKPAVTETYGIGGSGDPDDR